MLTEARTNDGKGYTVHMTNKLPKVDKFLKNAQQDGSKVQVVYRLPNARSLRVDLGDPLAD
jgi:hypothetical protein